VVAVLLAALRVAPGRLQVAALVGADPHVGPRGRDRERFDALERRLVGMRSPLASRYSNPLPAWRRE
jgi:hypothetical protein